MAVTAQALHCPNCGAPLHPSQPTGLTVCVYCGSAVRLAGTPGETTTVVEGTLPEDVMRDLKQRLLQGRRADALALYRARTGASAADAESAVASLAQQVSIGIMRRQTLSPLGVIFVGLAVLLLAAGGLAGLLGRLHPLLALLLVGFAAFELWFFGPAVAKTLRFLDGRLAPALIRRSAPVGRMTLRGQEVSTVRLWLEVQPEDATPFEAELLVPVREQSLPKAQPGRRLRVKYLPADPGQVIYVSAED